MGKIHGLSTLPDLLFFLSSSKTYKNSLSERGLKTAGTHIFET